MARIGILGGTFDPIHYGHLILAEQAREQFDLEKVIFITAASPPHKQNAVSADAELRFQMTKAAVEENDCFSSSRIEFERDGPSYTVDTLREIIEAESDNLELFLILGADEAWDFMGWRDPHEIAKMVKLLVANRPGRSAESLIAHYPPEIREKVFRISMPDVDISSTDIRQRVSDNKSIKYMVPPNVERIILQEGLYKGEL